MGGGPSQHLINAVLVYAGQIRPPKILWKTLIFVWRNSSRIVSKICSAASYVFRMSERYEQTQCQSQPTDDALKGPFPGMGALDDKDPM